jgi:polygalacturonase
VVFPEGAFLTGAIHLKSGVNLHVPKNATLPFNRHPKLYLPLVFTRWEGTECMNYPPFIYAFEQSNIAISGEGTLDGNADCDHWWNWSGKGGCGKKSEPTHDFLANAHAVGVRIEAQNRQQDQVLVLILWNSCAFRNCFFLSVWAAARCARPTLPISTSPSPIN